jgi:hypothetical protein
MYFKSIQNVAIDVDGSGILDRLKYFKFIS